MESCQAAIRYRCGKCQGAEGQTRSESLDKHLQWCRTVFGSNFSDELSCKDFKENFSGAESHISRQEVWWPGVEQFHETPHLAINIFPPLLELNSCLNFAAVTPELLYATAAVVFLDLLVELGSLELSHKLSSGSRSTKLWQGSILDGHGGLTNVYSINWMGTIKERSCGIDERGRGVTRHLLIAWSGTQNVAPFYNLFPDCALSCTRHCTYFHFMSLI